MGTKTELRLDEALSDEQFDSIQAWYEDEVAEPQRAAKHDVTVLRALRELRLRRQALCHEHGVHGCDHPDHWGMPS